MYGFDEEVQDYVSKRCVIHVIRVESSCGKMWYYSYLTRSCELRRRKLASLRSSILQAELQQGKFNDVNEVGTSARKKKKVKKCIGCGTFPCSCEDMHKGKKVKADKTRTMF
jgi:hypothetical protein